MAKHKDALESEKIIVAGSGGQGIMLLGKLLAEAGMHKGLNVTWLPAYGPEVRGGTANCMVVLSSSEIGSPFVQTADTLIVMNQLSLDKFIPRLEKGGLLVYNSSLASVPSRSGCDLRGYPFSEVAVSSAGSMKVANMVALGAYLAIKKQFQIEDILEIIRKQKRELLDINRKALLAGAALVK